MVSFELLNLLSTWDYSLYFLDKVGGHFLNIKGLEDLFCFLVGVAEVFELNGSVLNFLSVQDHLFRLARSDLFIFALLLFLDGRIFQAAEE